MTWTRGATLVALILSSLVGVAAPQPVAAAGITVDTLADTVANDGVCSLREAITAANSDTAGNGCAAGAGADTIVFAVSGTIALGSRLPVVTSEITIDGSGQSITIDGQTTDGNNGTEIARVNAGGNLTLVELTVTRGRSQGCDGGDTCGAVLNYGDLDVVDSTFSNNQGNGFTNGIAITNRGGGRLDVVGSTFVNNRGVSAGAIWNASDASNTLTVATVTNSTFVGNSAGGGSAGAIYNTFNASLTVTNSTFSANGGGTTLNNAGGAAPIVLRNSIVTGTTSGGTACAGPYTADAFNLATDGTCGGATTSGSLNLDVLADNGGLTQTVMLLAGSAAIGAGDAAVCAAAPVGGVDQRGVVRPNCDVGSVESNTVIVDDTGDASDATPGDSRCETALNNGVCTLRAAMEEANANAAINTIAFDIPGAGPHTIAPATALPAVTDTIVIDGYTQPGAQANTEPVVRTNAVVPVRLLGPGVGSGVVGLDLSGSTDSVLRGMTISGFATAISAGERSVIAGNFIGTDGVDVLGNIDGVLVDGVADVAIGGTEFADRNLISGNGGGISIIGDADNNVILNNLIGADASGTMSLANGSGIIMRARDGVDISTRDGNQIGTGFLSGRNTIAGNNGEGISIGAGSVDTQVIGNWIGVGFGVAGATLGNNQSGPDTESGNWGGIVVRGGSRTTIGGISPNGNRIANNNNGVVILSGDGNRIVGNEIRDNADRGIVISGVGANDPGDLDEGANRGQNHPLPTSAVIEGGNLVIDYSIDTVDLEAYPITLEFFEADSGASGEGERFIRRETVTGPGAGTTQFLVGTIVNGDPIVATATDADGNTSTFSPAAIVGGSNRLVSSVAGDRFGAAIDVDGNLMVVSSPSADVGADGAGVVQVYRRSAADQPWVRTLTIPSPDPEENGGFGDSVALSGSRLAVGESDRFTGADEPGRVHVFELLPFGATHVGTTTAPAGGVAGDEFGTSLAWVAGLSVAVGAPGANGGRGAIHRVDLSLGEPITLSPTVETTPASIAAGLQPLDRFGESIAVGFGSGVSGLTAFVGAPGTDSAVVGSGPDSGALHILQLDPVTGVVQGVVTKSGYGAGAGVGSAVAMFGNVAVAAGYGTSMQLHLNEWNGVEWTSDVVLGAGVSTDFASFDRPNDYLDIEGGTIAVGFPGAGGGVALFRFDGENWPSTPSQTIVPAERQSGDRIGRAVGLDGRTLVTGAPGDDGLSEAATDAGGFYSYDDLAVVASFVDGPGEFWTDPVSWDGLVVPGAGDTAIIAEGSVVEVDVDTVVARLVVDSTATVTVLDGFRLGSGSTLIRTNAIVTIQPGGELVLRNDALVDGRIIVEDAGAAGRGLLTLDGAVAVSGAGRLTAFGQAQKTGPGTATVDVERILTYPSTIVSVGEGALELTGADVRDGRNELQNLGLVGEASVAAGAELRVIDDLQLTDAASIGVDIDGDPSSTANYGRIVVTGELIKAGGLVVNDNTAGLPTGEAYPIISCLDCRPGSFDSVPAQFVETVVGTTSISVGWVPNKILQSDIEGRDLTSARFGFDVDVDSNPTNGGWAVVTAPFGQDNVGGAYFYQRNDVSGIWEFSEFIEDTTSINLGIQASLDGELLVLTSNDGAVIYARSGGTYGEVARVSGGVGSLGNVDLDGTLLVVGEPNAGVPGASVYSLVDPASPLLLERLVPAGVVPVASFGERVAIRDLGGGNAAVAVGAPTAPGGGAVYVFKRSAGSFLVTPADTFTSPAVPADGAPLFGNAVALGESTLVVGERLGGPDNDSGEVWVYEGVPGAYGAPVALEPSSVGLSDQFGSDVAIDGDVIVAGATAGGPGRRGSVEVFSRTAGGWSTGTELLADDGVTDDDFGVAVSVLGNDVLVGAWRDDNARGVDAGAAYSFQFVPPPPPVRPSFDTSGGNGLWSDPVNWSTGVVPGPDDDVVIPAGPITVIVDGDFSVGSVEVAGVLTISDTNALTLTGGPLGTSASTVAPGGVFVVESGATATLGGVVDISGLVTNNGTVSVQDDTTLTGTGTWSNQGRFNSAISVTIDVAWQSDPASVLEVPSGSSTTFTPDFVESGLVLVNAGGRVFYEGAMVFDEGSLLDVEIVGPSSSSGNYGQASFANMAPLFEPGATLRTDPFAFEYDPVESDNYPVVLCESGCPLFPNPKTEPLVQSIVDGDLVLALPREYRPVVAIDGDTAVVAIPSQDRIFVLDRSAGVWSDLQTIDSPDAGYDDFGTSVSLALPYLAVGVPGSDAVEVYEFDGEEFRPLRTYNGQVGSRFGSSVSAAEGRLAVGAPLYDATATDVGAVDLFVLATPTTIPDRRISDGSDGDLFGSTVAITGGDLWVAALGDDGPTDSDPDTGVVRRYDSGGTFANAELRAPGQGTGATISAVDGRAAVGTIVSTDVLVFDTGFGARTIAGASTGFGNQLALVGDRIYIDDEGTSVTSVFDLNAATDQFVLSGLLSSAPGTVSLAADGASVVRGIFGTGEVTSGLDAAVFSQLSLPETVVENPVFDVFDLSASASEVSVASTGIATSAIPNRNVSGSTGQTGSVASTPLVGIDLNQPFGSNVAASPVASLTIGESVLAAIDGTSSLDTLPLTDIDITVPIPNTDPQQFGGWEELLRQIGDPARGLSRPLQNIQFGEVKGFAEVQRLRLDQISLAGTPVASLPVASLVLGSTPVASLNADIDWCAEIDATGSAVNCSTGIDPNTATLVELTLAGIPVASLPVASLPVASLPVASLPVASLPVASLDLASTPVASLPVASLPVASLPVASLPVASLPVASLLVETVDAAGNVASLPVASLPVASLPVASLPVASLPVASLPVASLDTSGTVLEDFADSANPSLVSIPVASLDLVSSPVASLPVASLDVASLPVASLPVASLPVASLPVASLPVASLDVRGTPVASLTTDGTLATLPVASLPVASLPVASLPVASLPVASLPVASLPVASLPVASLPVASLPVASLPVASLPVASLDVASLPVASLPVASLPVASLGAVVDCTAVDCSSTTLTLAEALDIAPVANATFEAFAPLLAGLRWSEILPALRLSEDEFVQILIDLDNAAGGTFTLGDVITEGGGFGDLTVGELPIIVLQQLFLGDIAPYLDGVRLGDLVGNILDFDGNPLDPAAVEAALTAAKNRLTLQLVDLTDFDDLTLGDLVDEDGNPLLQGLTLGEVAPYLTGLRFDDLLTSFPGLSEDDVRGALEDILAASDLQLGQLLVGDLTFDDLLASDEFGQLTLAELLLAILAENPDALDGITFGDLLLAFLAPSDYPWDAIVFDEIDPADLPGLIGAVTFDTSFELTGTSRGQTVELTVALPDTAGYLPGTSALNGVPLADPTIVGKVLTWRLTGLAPGTPYTVSFDLQPTLELGSSTVAVQARIVGVADGAVAATSSVAVQQAFEPNDTPETAVPLTEDTIYINHVASADDLDYFKIDVTDGQRVVVSLSNLAADFDVVIYGRSQNSTILPLVPPSGQSAGTPTADPVIAPDGTTEVQSELTGVATIFDGLPVVATGNRRGTATETVVTPPLEGGTVYVKVFGANGESSVRAAVLQAKVTEGTSEPECPPLTARFVDGVPGTSSIPADANTLFLVNQERLSALYPDDGSTQSYTQVFDRLDELVGFLNGTDGRDGAELGIVPGVLDVGQIDGIAADYATWDAEPCDSARANAVVGEITDEITFLRETRDIEHIVVIGGDDIVPHARVTDGAEISNQFDYRFTFGGNNAIAGSAWDRQVLTDEPYGDTAALDFGDRYLYITDTALGRLVDTPRDIAFQLEQFVESGGLLNPTTGLVVGYDFLDDGSEAITADLRGALNFVDDEFGSSRDDDTWTAADLAEKLFPSDGSPTPDVISLNAHFDHRRALPALDNTNKTEVDLFEATTVFAAAPDALTGRITFSMGCHSGLAVSDATIGVLSDDFAQGFTQQGGIYVGNTGYGYGDTETVAYSERLMDLFAEELVNPILFDRTTTAGQALQFAKNTFFSELGNVSVYDEKALMEATFYGLPFYRVSLEPEAPAPTPTTITQIDPITGSPVASFTVTPANEQIDGLLDGTKFVNRTASGDPLELKSPFNPAQPLELIDVSVVDPTDPTKLDLVARGAIVTGLTSTYVSPVDPIIVRPIADDSATQPEPDVGDVVFPVRPTAIRTTSQAEGERQTLALATGQFRGSSTNGVQRLDDEVNVAVYYAPASETDFTSPLIGAVDSFVVDGQLSISVDVNDTGGSTGVGSGVDRVYVLVAENPGVGTVEWRGVELAEDLSTPGRWVGSLSLAPGTEGVQLFIQAKDGAGNVGVSSNKGENFGAIAVEEPPAPPADVEVTIDGDPSADVPSTVWFDAAVTVKVTVDGLPVEYRLRNGPITPFPDDGLVIDAEGASRLVISVGGEEVVDRVIRIDRTPPTVQIASPVDGSTPVVGEPLVASLSCSDTSLVSCVAMLGGDEISLNEDLSGLPAGQYQIDLAAEDAAGNTASATSTFTMIEVQKAPEIDVVDGIRAPQLISDGFMVDIEFTDENFGDDEYTITIDWGDGDENTPDTSTTCVTSTNGGPTGGNPSCEILASPSADGPGLAVGNFEYAAPGVYAITVTVDDGTDTDVSVFQFATIYDPEAGRVSGAGFFWSGPEAFGGNGWGAPAFFGYNARYQGADPEPKGQTKLHLIGEFFFKSTSYDYLIINDTFAVAEGTGRFNGRSDYDFRVQGIDNGRLDFFQLTIEDADGNVVYDNGVKYDDGQLIEATEGDQVLLGGIRIRR